MEICRCPSSHRAVEILDEDIQIVQVYSEPCRVKAGHVLLILYKLVLLSEFKRTIGSLRERFSLRIVIVNTLQYYATIQIDHIPKTS